MPAAPRVQASADANRGGHSSLPIPTAAGRLLSTPSLAAQLADLLQQLLSLWRHLLFQILLTVLQLVRRARGLLILLPLLRSPLPTPLVPRLCSWLAGLLRNLHVLLLVLLHILQQVFHVEALRNTFSRALCPVAHTQQCWHQHTPQLRHLQVLLR
jgi:hypothetical protein